MKSEAASNVNKYLEELHFATSGERPEFIPENVFYRLAMKAKNETAEAFQAKVADEVIPSIRRHGAYMTPEALERAILSPEFGIRLLTALKDEQDKRRELEAANAKLRAALAALVGEKPKAKRKPREDRFRAEKERNGLTGIRDTAWLLGMAQNTFVKMFMDRDYLYRDRDNKLRPLPGKNNEYFELCTLTYGNGLVRVQTFVTPLGREMCRKLCKEM